MFSFKSVCIFAAAALNNYVGVHTAVLCPRKRKNKAKDTSEPHIRENTKITIEVAFRLIKSIYSWIFSSFYSPIIWTSPKLYKKGLIGNTAFAFISLLVLSPFLKSLNHFFSYLWHTINTSHNTSTFFFTFAIRHVTTCKDV